MEQIRQVMQQMIHVSEAELNDFLSQAVIRKFKRHEILSRPNEIPNEIFFINKGLVRVLITDNSGTEHTIHFALENQFIADYSNPIARICLTTVSAELHSVPTRLIKQTRTTTRPLGYVPQRLARIFNPCARSQANNQELQP
jgi:hypothetical protein